MTVFEKCRFTLMCAALWSLLACTKLESGNDRFSLQVEGGGGAAANSGTSSGGTGASDGTDPADTDCTDPQGFDGLGCYSCSPVDITTFERACSSSVCTAVDNAHRLTKLAADGSLPSLPVPTVPSGTGGTGSTLATSSTALPACSAVTAEGSPVYITGSSAAKPFLAQIAQQLAGSGVFLVYTSTGSCVGVDAILNQTVMTTGAAPAPAVAALVWSSSSSNGDACSLPSDGVVADIGVSDVFTQSCPGFEVANLEAKSVVDAHGPIQTMVFAVPSNSKHTEISAQAAYFVYGFGSEGGVLDPSGTKPIWNDEALIFKRSATSGTQAMLAATIGVPAERWRGVSHKTSDDIVASLLSAAASAETADKAIGILAADYIESKNLRATVSTLAFQDTTQPCAMYPDSTASARDKRNVRDGHYPIWGPLHLLYRADSTGNPINQTARQSVLDILGYLSGSKSLPNGVKLLDVYAQSGLIPECAMAVTRTNDGGNLLPFKPSNPCSCVFESKATGNATCQPCTVQGDCGRSESCSFGYCESGQS